MDSFPKRAADTVVDTEDPPVEPSQGIDSDPRTVLVLAEGSPVVYDDHGGTLVFVPPGDALQ